MRYPPDRPKGIPESANWAGGWDGGSWVDCSTGATEEYNRCQIFDEQGVLIFTSGYRLRNLNRAAERTELRYRYVDGTAILLRGGLVLDPVAGKPDEKDLPNRK